MKPFRILSRETVLDSPFCPVEKQCVVLPNGEKVDWWINRSRDAVIILPLLKDRRIMYQKNYKHGGGEVVYEFPAGMIDEGEDPIDAAKRELQEETGLISDTIRFLGSVFANPTGSSMKYHFFAAFDCEMTDGQDLEPAEQIELLFADNKKVLANLFFEEQVLTSSATMAAMGFLLTSDLL